MTPHTNDIKEAGSSKKIPKELLDQPKTEREWMDYRMKRAMEFWQYHFDRRFGTPPNQLRDEQRKAMM